ncbi:MAG: LacI family DNA-binding transcriptional regulator, partial [Ruthenibacterium sp.]
MTEKQATPKKATTSDVAKLSGVSQSTVSFVLNNKEGVSISEETRQRVLDAVKSLGYQHRAAANQRQKRAVIGYVFPTYVNMFHFMTAQMIDSEAARR